MTPGAIYIAVRDLLIASALGFILWKIYDAGQNAVQLKDLKAVTSELQQQQRQIQAYARQVTDANDQRSKDAQTITAAIAAHQQPLIVRVPVPAGARPMPAPIAGSGAQPAGLRESDGGSRGDSGSLDLRPAIAGFEQRWEATIADCREVLAKWPK